MGAPDYAPWVNAHRDPARRAARRRRMERLGWDVTVFALGLGLGTLLTILL